MELLAKYRNGILLILILVVSLIVFYYWANLKGVQQGANDSVVKIPGDPANGADTPLSDAEKNQIKDIATRIHDDINSWKGAFWRDNSGYYDLEKASDRVLVGVYNYYKVQFGSNMISDIKGETSFNPMTVTSTDNILKRFNNLNIN